MCLGLLPLIATAACVAMPPEGTGDEDLAAFDDAVASIGCELTYESDYLPVELQTGMTRMKINEVAQYRITRGEAEMTESGGFRLISGPCTPAAPVVDTPAPESAA